MGPSAAAEVAGRVGAFVLLGTALTLVLAGNDYIAGGNSQAQLAGLMIAIAVVTLIAELPRNGRPPVHQRRRALRGAAGGDRRRHRLHPDLAAAAPAARLPLRPIRRLHRQPPADPPPGGQAVLASIMVVSGAGLLAWLAWTPVHPAYDGNPTWGAVLGDSVLFWIFALCAEGLVFALIPLRFLDGAVLRSGLGRLAGAAGPLAAFFLYVFVLHGQSPVPGGVSLVLRAIAFFLLFGVVSVAFWAYFHWGGPSHPGPPSSPSPSTPERPGPRARVDQSGLITWPRRWPRRPGEGRRGCDRRGSRRGW